VNKNRDQRGRKYQTTIPVRVKHWAKRKNLNRHVRHQGAEAVLITANSHGKISPSQMFAHKCRRAIMESVLKCRDILEGLADGFQTVRTAWGNRERVGT